MESNENLINDAYFTLKTVMASLRQFGQDEIALRAADLIEPALKELKKGVKAEKPAQSISLNGTLGAAEKDAPEIRQGDMDVVEDGRDDAEELPEAFEGGASAADDAQFGLKPCCGEEVK